MSRLKRRIMALSLTSVLAALGVQSSAAETTAKGTLKRGPTYVQPEVSKKRLLRRSPELKLRRERKQGFLVRGENGEYYYLTRQQLARLAHRGKCHKSQCARVGNTRVIVKKSTLRRFLLRRGTPLRSKLQDQALAKSMDRSIQRRQQLGAKVRSALTKQGFEVGVLYPTKAG